MYCLSCGAQIEDGATFCPACGAAQNMSAQQPLGNTVNETADMPMKWFKFLIYFSLFAGAVLNIISGIGMLSGSQYQGNAELVYSFYDGLKALDVFMGVAAIALAVFAIYTRFRLSGFYSNGPTMLLITYAASAAVQVIYIVGAYMVLPSEVTGAMNLTSTFTNVAVSVAMIFINKTYFGKRAHLFKN